MVTLCLNKPERLGKTTGGYLMLNTVRGAVNIIYWWIPYAFMLKTVSGAVNINYWWIPYA